MLLIFYIFSIVFVQGVGIYLAKEGIQQHESEEMIKFFGNVQTSILSLFTAATGGNDWQNYYMAIGPAGELYSFVFLFFVAFSNIALLNILTGIFVENAMANAEPTREQRAMENIQEEGR